ncbi:MAG: putative inactive lipase [Acidimicrobiales bacterium]|nr:putative inactive lipase [Acidimicrobiales bacterium]RIK07103.1 MAG: hypothetical protein DCC48_04745 [Acidobacteriota bacterium]
MPRSRIGHESRSTTTVLVAAVSILAASCSGDFYDPPGLRADVEAGDVLRSEPIALQEGVDGTAQRVLYVSTDIEGEPIAVSGVIVRPTGDPPEGGFPVVSWAHGTTGVADQCAPSHTEPFALDGMAEIVNNGYVLAATDYEGLGTPGIHPYLVGESEARGVLDIARAARQEAGGGNKVVVWGHSQGGHAALFAHQIAGDYADDLEVLGVVATAPPAGLAQFLQQGVNDQDFLAFSAQAYGSWAQVYPEADPATIATGEALRSGGKALEECTVSIASYIGSADVKPSDVFKADPADTAPWPELTEENTPVGDERGIPLFVAHGGSDQLVPMEGTVAFVQASCSAGEAVEFVTEPEWDHNAAFHAPMPQYLQWMSDRVADAEPPSTC